MSVTYEQFLESKLFSDPSSGFEVAESELNAALFDWQRQCVRWALRRGRAAFFMDCGLGKTLQQLDWASKVSHKTQKPIIILAPLAVAEQTISEARKFGIDGIVHVHDEREIQDCIAATTNYERIDKFNPANFGGVVLDESSILKHQDGKTRTRLIQMFAETPYRLCCTATPAPNDLMELGNHCEFLGVMTMPEMLATYFTHDGGETSKWVLKAHAEEPFYRFLCQWAIYVRNPSDIGFDGSQYILPPLRFHQHVIESSASEMIERGSLVPDMALTLNDRRAARRESLGSRVDLASDIANSATGQVLVWCDLNAESDALAKSIRGAVEVRGSDTEKHKTDSMMAFARGDLRVLVSKPSICGHGMNFQSCATQIFVGLSDSYEQQYQAIRRSWRFGQKNPVDIHIVTHEREGAVVANIKRKEKQAEEMAAQMVKHMREIQTTNVKGASRNRDEYQEEIATGKAWALHLGDSVDVIKRIESESVGYTIFSPPFASLYTYTNSERDMGNTRDWSEFYKHFQFLIGDIYRTTMPGRLASFHCMNLPTSKERDGVIGIHDFRGDLIRLYERAGFIYHSEVVIWKDPVTAMQRTKALGLLHKTIRKDSAMSRQGIPDYLVTMRKPGGNPQPISHTPEEFPVSLWQRFASPVWMDINPSDTLQYRSARENDGEKHICPLQLEVIRRAILLWSNPGDLVASWFAGIGSEGYVALEMGRKFIGCELKRSYWQCAVNNLHAAERAKHDDMFADLLTEEVPA